tara:strand:+ start:461 stop:703 length:243 start_codon:yes stop_codon:yes gene_type:complete
MEKPCHAVNGIINKIAQKKAILPKFLCQKLGRIKGNSAIDNNKPENGIMLNKGNFAPSSELEANTGVINNAIQTNKYLNI